MEYAYMAGTVKEKHVFSGRIAANANVTLYVARLKKMSDWRMAVWFFIYAVIPIYP